MEKTKEYTSPYEMDGRIPWPKAIVYGLQHVLAMFVGNLTPLIVIKKDNNREQYDRTKLEGGVLRACYKRPVAAADIQATIDSIETAIFSREEKEIPSSQIGEIVMESLKKLDPVAYVRFASVYREFKDVNTFMDELKKILE